MFPEKFGNVTSPDPNVDEVNTKYDGWFVKENHLFFANGKSTSRSMVLFLVSCVQDSMYCLAGDPWRDATLAADGTHFQSTPEQPLALHDAYHTSDLITANGAADPTVLAVQQQGLGYVAKWLAEWKPSVQ